LAIGGNNTLFEAWFLSVSFLPAAVIFGLANARLSRMERISAKEMWGLGAVTVLLVVLVAGVFGTVFVQSSSL
jgi:hypothetical protein